MPASERNGTLQATGGRLAIRFEREFAHASENVWRAITESGELARWFPAELEGPHVPGGAIRIVSWTERFPPVRGRFTAYEPSALLEYTWGDELLRWELRPRGVGSVLTFTNVLDDDAMRAGPAAIAASWHACLDVLEFVLSDQTPPYSVDDRAGELVQTYLERFGEGVAQMEGHQPLAARKDERPGGSAAFGAAGGRRKDRL